MLNSSMRSLQNYSVLTLQIYPVPQPITEYGTGRYKLVSKPILFVSEERDSQPTN